MFLYIELGGAFRLSVYVLRDGSVEALHLIADVVDDEGVTTTSLKDVDVIPLLYSGL